MENNIDNPMQTYVIDGQTSIDYNNDYVMIMQIGNGTKDMIHIMRDDLDKYIGALLHIQQHYDKII